MSEAFSPQRYNSIAIILHWVMAIAFIAMLISGVVMEYAQLEQSLKFNLYQWHKASGVLLLIAVVLRILWRMISTLKNQIPPLPENFKPLEQKAAKLGHLGLYAVMIAMPLTGWMMVSSSVYGLPTIVFGWFEWPHIPGIQGDEAINKISNRAHMIVGIAFALLIGAHIAAVIKHALFDNENLLTRMWWSKKGQS